MYVCNGGQTEVARPPRHPKTHGSRTLHVFEVPPLPLHKNTHTKNFIENYPSYLTMNMNMCIIMTMNIYITKDNEEKLSKLPKGQSKSGLINGLLNAHFNGAPVIMDEYADAPSKQEVANTVANLKADSERFFPPPTEKISLGYVGEKACCEKKNPCQHWQWNEPDQLWQNILSGRTRENEL